MCLAILLVLLISLFKPLCFSCLVSVTFALRTRGALEQFMDYALAFVGSPFTVGTVEEKRVCPTLRLQPQWSQVRWSQRLLSSVPLSTMLTVMATALWCVWVAHCSHAPEPTQVASAERRHRRLNVSICEKVMGQSCADYPHHFWLL